MYENQTVRPRAVNELGKLAVRIDLQPLIAKIYARSRYDRDIDYSKPLAPPLIEEDTAWLAKRIGKK